MSTTTHLMTAVELFNLADDSHRHELIQGELLTMSPTGEEHGAVTMNLSVALALYVRSKDLGVVYAAETGFKLESDPDTVLAPDISFIARERVGARSRFYRLGPPDLAVEVLSPRDRRTNLEQKAAMWLRLGAKSVWLVNPMRRTVEVIRANADRRLFHESDELVDETVPGFRVAVSEIFA